LRYWTAEQLSIETAGAEVRYLSPYSPDLDPIALAFNMIHNLLGEGANSG
jgi:hypothetical protein